MHAGAEPTPRWEWLATAAVLAIPWVVVCVAFWPGHMNGDTLYQLQQVQTGEITNKHSPVLQWIWSLLWPLGVGAGWSLAATTLALLLGLFLVLRSLLRPLAAGVAAALIALSPQVLGYLSTVSRDTWFAALAILTFGLLVEAARRQGRLRLALVIGALLAGWLGMATRQNAGSVFLVAFALAAVLALPWLPRLQRPWAGWSRPLQVLGAGFAGLAICLVFMGSQHLLSSAVGVKDDQAEEFLFGADLDRIDEDTSTSAAEPGGADSGEDESGEDEFGEVVTAGDWLDAITAHPLSYLRVRAEVLLDNLGIGGKVAVVYHPGIDPNLQGFGLRNPELDRAAVDYLQLFSDDQLHGSIVHEVWIYVLVAILAAVVFLRRGASEPLLVLGGLGLAMVTLQLGLFVVAVVNHYRFEYVAVVGGAALGVLLVAQTAFSYRPGFRNAIGNRELAPGAPKPAAAGSPRTDVPAPS